MKDRTCSMCDKPLGVANKSGLCRPHFIAKLNSDPAIQEKRTEGNRRHAATPEGRVTRRQAARIAVAKRAANPEWRAKAAANMRRIQLLACTPEAVAKRDEISRGRKVSATRMAWCPPEYRDQYRALKRRFPKMKADEGRRIILDQARVDRARMSPFERQEAALAAQMRRQG